MRSRMDRYKAEDNNVSISRSTKNEELYQNLGTNTKYTNFTDVSNLNAVSLSDASKNSRTREGYQQIKKYDTLIDTPKVKKELDEFNHLYQDYENRIYDINSVLDEARKNRTQKDALEEKRKLKNTNYNILASLNQQELEKYHKNKKEDTMKPDEYELKELIHTITSKTIKGELSKQASLDLLSDLMATKVEDKVPAPKEDMEDEQLNLSREILDKEALKKVEEMKFETNSSTVLKDIDNSFYTRSMDLSDKDFDMDFEFSEGIQDKKIPVVVKVFLIIILLIVVAIAIYFTIKNF